MRGWRRDGGRDTGRLKGREGVSTEWSKTSIHKHRYIKKAHTYQLISVLGREGMCGKDISIGYMSGHRLGFGNGVEGYILHLFTLISYNIKTTYLIM